MANPAPFQDKVIAVTGASRGTGLAVARYLLARGAKVSMAATSESNLAAAHIGIEKDMPEVTDRVMTFAADITKLEEIKAWIEATKSKFGPLDGAANVACAWATSPYMSEPQS
jgi:NAD(P)-dependent dehydrogenase (short-subunit alcohol dehydrogenase family)